MELKVYEAGEEIGVCNVYDEGLYWRLECRCRQKTDQPKRLFGGGENLGIPIWTGDNYLLSRRVSKISVPCFSFETTNIPIS